jgi:hypothetical protein
LDERVGVVGDESLLVGGLERLQFCDDFRIVDGHRIGNKFLSGRIDLLMAALMVWTGSLTTWLRRRRIATLERM